MMALKCSPIFEKPCMYTSRIKTCRFCAYAKNKKLEKRFIGEKKWRKKAVQIENCITKTLQKII